MHDVGPYTRLGREVDHESCAWASTTFNRSGSIRMKKKATLTISEGSMILRGLTELHLIDQRCQTGLKSMLCGKASATPFCQQLSRDFRSQALSHFFLQVKKAGDEARFKAHFAIRNLYMDKVHGRRILMFNNTDSEYEICVLGPICRNIKH